MSDFKPSLFNFIFNSSFLQRFELWYKIKSSSGYIKGVTLDFGCGEKPYYELITESTKYLGVDIQSSNNEKADFLYDQLPLKFNNNFFDSIICTQVLYQVDDDRLVLLEFNRCLKEGGILLLSVPFIWFDADHSQQRRYSKKTIVDKLTDADFTIVEHSQTVGI